MTLQKKSVRPASSYGRTAEAGVLTPKGSALKGDMMKNLVTFNDLCL
jgi:hypothetical protein